MKFTKSILENDKTYRDGIPRKQPNKVGTKGTTVPLRTPIPISVLHNKTGVSPISAVSQRVISELTS